MDAVGERTQELLLILLAGLFPFQFLFSLDSFTVNASYADPLVGIILAMFVLGLLPRPQFDRLFTVLAVFVVAASVGIGFRYVTQPAYFVPIDSLAALLKLNFSIGYMIAIYILLRPALERRIPVFALTSVLVAGTLAVANTVSAVMFDVSENAAVFSNRNLYATYLVFGIFLMLSILAWEHRRRSATSTVPVLLMLGLAASFVALVSTASRAPFVGLALGVTLVIDWKSLLEKIVDDVLLVTTGILASNFAFAMIFLAEPMLINRSLSALRGSSLGHRMQTWPASLEGLISYPLFGIGVGQHPNFLSRSVTPHNTLILIVSATGVLGLVLALWFVVGLLRRAYGMRFQHDHHYLGYFGGFIVAILVVGLFHDINNFRTFWIAAGLLTAATAADSTLHVSEAPGTDIQTTTTEDDRR